MRLCSIINVWADAVELLPYCVQNLANCGVDGIIIVWSEKSNYGEIEKDYLPMLAIWGNKMPTANIHFFQHEPFLNHPANCETNKRNFGLDQAKRLGYTHFLTMDQDEFYEPEKFKKVREYIDRTGVKGIVCPSNVYFKSPMLTIGRDVTLVPFIHEIQPGIKHEMNRAYPYAFGDKQHIRIDPTRQLSIRSGVEYTEDVVLEHMSWVRKDYEKKIRNSTARNNIQKSTIVTDLRLAEEGYYVEFYRKRLTRCPNLFGIHEFSKESNGVIRENLQSGATRDGVHHTD